jgi:hypothetical protein
MTGRHVNSEDPVWQELRDDLSLYVQAHIQEPLLLAWSVFLRHPRTKGSVS